MNCLSYICGKGLDADFHLTIGSLYHSTVRLWVLIDDETLRTLGGRLPINESDARQIAISNERTLFDAVYNAIERDGTISPKGGPFQLTKNRLH